MDKLDVRTAGHWLRGIRAGVSSLAVNRSWMAGVLDTIQVTSPAFTAGRAMPVRYTADGASLSPPLKWDNLPAGARSLVLLVEDPDIPFPTPLVHAIAYGIRPESGSLPEAALPYRLRGPARDGFAMGRNGFSRPGWIAPSPPPGHGPHHYAFQVFALDSVPRFDWPPGRGYLMARIRPHMIGRGTLFGAYERT